MGCNFYTLRGSYIGKRSAAGMYCWDCGVPLNKEGKEGVHKAHADDCKRRGVVCCDCLILKQCPKCGKKPKEESLTSSSMGRELGFNKKEFKPKTGVAFCSSFTWAIRPSKLNRILFVKDEYGRKYTVRYFKEKILSECPIEYFDLIGESFS